jgi:hypothetical protein
MSLTASLIFSENRITQLNAANFVNKGKGGRRTLEIIIYLLDPGDYFCMVLQRPESEVAAALSNSTGRSCAAGIWKDRLMKIFQVRRRRAACKTLQGKGPELLKEKQVAGTETASQRKTANQEITRKVCPGRTSSSNRTGPGYSAL